MWLRVKTLVALGSHLINDQTGLTESICWNVHLAICWLILAHNHVSNATHQSWKETRWACPKMVGNPSCPRISFSPGNHGFDSVHRRVADPQLLVVGDHPLLATIDYLQASITTMCWLVLAWMRQKRGTLAPCSLQLRRKDKGHPIHWGWYLMSGPSACCWGSREGVCSWYDQTMTILR